MAASSALTQSDSSWQAVATQALHGDPLLVLDTVKQAVVNAEKAGDVAAQMALAANALAFMVMDWSRFTDWRDWIVRFDGSDAKLPAAADDASSVMTARMVGRLAAGLLRGDAMTARAPLGQQLERLADTPNDSVQLALAAGVLLPWF